MIKHLVGALEPEHLAGGGASHAQLLDDRFVLTSPQELKINYSLLTCASHVTVVTTGFSKVPTFYMQLVALTPATTRQGGPKFGRELLHLSVCIAPTGEERELLERVTPIHVEGEKTAHWPQTSLMLSLIFQGRAVVTYQRLDRGHEWYNVI